MPVIRSLFLLLPALAIVLSCAGGSPRPAPPGPAATVDPDSLVVAGHAAADNGDYQNAKDLFDTALESDPEHAGAHRGLARIYTATGDPVSAIHFYERLLELPGDHGQDYLDLAGVLAKSGRREEALALLTDAVARYPNNSRLQAELGRALLERGRTGAAIDHLRIAVDLGAGKTAHRSLAQTLFAEGRYDEAQSALASYDREYPGDFDTNMKLAYIHFERGDFKGALPYYRAATHTNSESVDARVGVARTLEALGRIDTAIRVYDGILEMRGLNPEMEPIIISQANLLNQRGEYSQTLDLLDRAAARFPETPGLSCARGLALAGEGRYEEAIAVFDRATGDPRWSQFAHEQIRRLQSGGGR